MGALDSPSQILLLAHRAARRGRRQHRYLLNGANHGDLTFLGNAKAALPWSIQKVMGLITSFLRLHLGS